MPWFYHPESDSLFWEEKHCGSDEVVEVSAKRAAEITAQIKGKRMSLVRRSQPAPKTPSVPLHIKYRPQTLDDVVGQDHVTTNLAQLFESGRVPHTFLFTGPSGTGKTTLARIIASMVGCSDLIEHDAARFNSIQAVRSLVDGAQYAGLGDNSGKFLIIDECQRISTSAFDVLLKSTEEPAEHLYWAFCTTEPGKIPKTLRTRAHAYDLKPVMWDLLADYLGAISEQEKLHVQKDFIDIAARKAEGGVRQGLVYLSMLDGITDRAQAMRLLEEYDAQEEGPIQLAKLLVGKGATWEKAMTMLAKFADVSPESIRLTVLNYATAAARNEMNEKSAARLLAIVGAFSTPCDASERFAPLVLAIGGLLIDMGG